MPRTAARKLGGLTTGIILCITILILPTPREMSIEAQRVMAVTALMVAWWVTEAIHFAITALIPLVLFPLFNVTPFSETAPHYSDPNIFLFMGGFMIAMAMQKCGLHKRLALIIASKVGEGPWQLIGGFMIATAFLSMWISNTATTVMMVPIAMAVVTQENKDLAPEHRRAFGMALMLGIAYASSVASQPSLARRLTPSSPGRSAHYFPTTKDSTLSIGSCSHYRCRWDS